MSAHIFFSFIIITSVFPDYHCILTTNFAFDDRTMATTYAYSRDPRFTYTLYVPASSSPQPLTLTVLIHGIQRNVEAMLDSYKEFADQNQCVLFVPLIPQGEHYIELISSSGNIRYDLLLLEMIDEMKNVHPMINTNKFLLHGFSAGGQFAHRFGYLHSHRLLGLSIGAPGSITLLDDTLNWPEGTRDLKSIFNGNDINFEIFKLLPIEICVGDRDRRLENAERLKLNYVEVGLANVRFDIVPNAGHDSTMMRKVVSQFFQDVLRK
jgi:hypothetical protein